MLIANKTDDNLSFEETKQSFRNRNQMHQPSLSEVVEMQNLDVGPVSGFALINP